MSIFQIPEIIALIGPFLSNKDLIHFCLVSKTWNTAFAPYLWKSAPTQNDEHSEQVWKIFRSLVESDILASQQQRFQQGGDMTTNNGDSSDNLSLPALSRNGRWIRTLYVNLCDLRKPYQQQPYHVVSLPLQDPTTTFTTSTTNTSVVQRHSHHHNHDPKLTTIELLFHLFKRCPNIHSLKLSGNALTATEYYFWKSIITAGFPVSIKNLDIRLDSNISLVKSTLLPMLFKQCSPGLHKLSIWMPDRYAHRRSIGTDVDTRQDVVDTPLPSMKDLSITYNCGGTYPPSCMRFLIRCVNLESLTLTNITHMWLQALVACGHLKSLTIERVYLEQFQHLTTALTNGLPCLDTIHFRARYSDREWTMASTETTLASMLSAGRAGWKSLHLPLLGKTSANALVKHCSTLEELKVSMSHEVTSQHLHQILSTSPGLVTLDVQTINGNLARILAQDFIDQDPGFDYLNPWLCESTLKTLRLRIAEIPRPGISDGVQLLVYDRLARFKYLERLELGNQGVRGRCSEEERIQALTETKDRWGNHADCLPMTLNSGLHILEGLKEIREVNVACMTTSIGVEEAKWMIRSWPKLEAIRGLKEPYRLNTEREAAFWLYKHHPRIQQKWSRDVIDDSGGMGGGMCGGC